MFASRTSMMLAKAYSNVLVPVHGEAYNRKVLTETGNRTQGLSFNDRALYQLSYFDRLLFCYLNSGFILINRVQYGVFVRCAQRWAVHVCRSLQALTFVES